MLRLAALLFAACATSPAPSAPSPAPSQAPPAAALAPRKVPPGWESMADETAGIAVAFSGASTSTTRKMAQGGRSGRMQ